MECARLRWVSKGTWRSVLLALALSLAVAAPPDSVRPIAAPASAIEAYREWSAREGRPDALVCESIVDEVRLCFTVIVGTERKWVGERLLLDWQTDRPTFFSTMRERAAGKVRAASQSSEGLSYWTVGGVEGWSMAGLLRPDELMAATEATELRLAAPLEETLLAWKPGDAELDQVMAVGMAEMVKSQPKSVSPVVLAWDGSRWSVYGVAVSGDPVPAEPADPR